MNYKTERCWCVTGTPFSNSLGQLENQACLLGFGPFSRGRTPSTWAEAHGPPNAPALDFCGILRGKYMPHHRPVDMTNADVASRLRKVMIRHTKGMRIGGEVALALPDADCSTCWLDMSADERLLYDVHACADGHGFTLQDITRLKVRATATQTARSHTVHLPSVHC